MIVLANRVDLDTRTLLSRLHNRLQTRVTDEQSPVTQVWYHTSTGNKVGVRATIDTQAFLGRTYPVEIAELQIAFDFPPDRAFDHYTIQWVESDRRLTIGWHQDETDMDLGECHFQLDYQGETIRRDEANFLDAHPLTVVGQRIDHLVAILDAIS